MRQNPFVITGYVSPEYFCDREKETAAMLNAIRNSRHITMFSPRRMGKTGLIRHLFYNASREKEFIPVYVDIMATTSLSEFTELFGKAVLTAAGRNEALMKKILKKLSALRLKLTFDHITGEPAISLDVSNQREAEQSLDTIFRFISEQPYSMVIAVDEFQQISGYNEKQTEALLRSNIQSVNNISFIFSGSRRHVLTNIFSSPDRPLFNMTQMMEIDSIDHNGYSAFIKEKFKKGSLSISTSALEHIIEISSLHTFYVQYFCNRLYSEHKDIDVDEVDNILIDILKENEAVYAGYIGLLTPTQYRVLKAIALNEGIVNPLSKEFLSAYNLGAASSVSQAVKSLEDKEFVFLSKDKYRLNDVFLAHWIKYKTL